GPIEPPEAQRRIELTGPLELVPERLDVVARRRGVGVRECLGPLAQDHPDGCLDDLRERGAQVDEPPLVVQDRPRVRLLGPPPRDGSGAAIAVDVPDVRPEPGIGDVLARTYDRGRVAHAELAL